MTGVVVVGGGFAGVWSAAAAARVRHLAGLAPEELPVTLIAPGDDMVIRPRLYERDPGTMRVPLARVLEPIDVRHVRAAARAVDAGRSEVVLDAPGAPAATVPFGAVVVATGSALRRPPLPGAQLLFDVDTIGAAVALDRHLRGLADARPAAGRFTAVVVGAGFTGVEVATELVARLRDVAAAAGCADEARVVLVEQAGAVGPELGAGPRPVIERALAEQGVEVRLGTTIAGLDARGVRLHDGEQLPALTTIWTAGLRASTITETVDGPRDALGRLLVDETLLVEGQRCVFAAGDTAAAPVEDGHRSMQSCQHAHAMGRVAGHNAAGALLGRRLLPFAPDPYVTCLDLGASGAVYTTGWEREVRRTGAEAKDLKRTINRAIYPPTDHRARILAAADPGAAARTPQVAGVS